MTNNPVVWFEIYVDDMQRARRFYETVLAAPLSKIDTAVPGEQEVWGFPMFEGKAGAAGALVKMPGLTAGTGGTLIYFSCEDCSLEASRVEAAGGKLHKDKFAIGGHGYIALAIDTEGNMFGLHSRK